MTRDTGEPTVGGTAWFNDCGAVRIRYPGRWCYPSLQAKAGAPPPVLTTLHDFYLARLGRLQRGAKLEDLMPEITNVIDDVFRDHLFGSRPETSQTATMNLFLHYQIEDMVRHIMLGEGAPDDAEEVPPAEEGSTAGKDTGNELEKIGRYREFLRKRNKEANEDSNRPRKANDDAPTSGILAELCRDSDRMNQPMQHPTPYTHGSRVDFQEVLLK